MSVPISASLLSSSQIFGEWADFDGGDIVWQSWCDGLTARLCAIKADIEAHLTHASLSQGAIAKRQQVSDSYIRKLFGGEGTSFSEYVLTRRLVRAHRMLADRRRAGVGIASIAYDAGFGDLSYFNRAFKRRYDATPSEVRDAIESSD